MGAQQGRARCCHWVLTYSLSSTHDDDAGEMMPLAKDKMRSSASDIATRISYLTTVYRLEMARVKEYCDAGRASKADRLSKSEALRHLARSKRILTIIEKHNKLLDTLDATDMAMTDGKLVSDSLASLRVAVCALKNTYRATSPAEVDELMDDMAEVMQTGSEVMDALNQGTAVVQQDIDEGDLERELDALVGTDVDLSRLPQVPHHGFSSGGEAMRGEVSRRRRVADVVV